MRLMLVLIVATLLACQKGEQTYCFDSSEGRYASCAYVTEQECEDLRAQYPPQTSCKATDEVWKGSRDG